MSAQPKVELLWWPGCPSRDRALADLRAALAEMGLDGDAVQMVRIDTEADAAREGFPGSPTIRVDGDDLLPGPAGSEPSGLTCRLYRLRDGRASPSPDPADLRAALRTAIATKEEVTDA